MSAIQSLCTVLVGCALCVGAFGQANDSNATLDQIVVTAARSPVELRQVGSSVTVIDRDEIERRQSRYVIELLRRVPGFSIAQTGVAGSQTQVRVRGAEANHVLVLIDGVRANDPGAGDEFRWEFLSTANVERIEVVRGPQSSLWGSDAVAAVVNVITRSQRAGRHGSAYAEGGSNGTANIGASGGASVGRWRLGGGLEFLDTDGQNISRSGSEKDGSDLGTVSASVVFDASNRLSFDAGARYVDAYSQFDPVDFANTGLPTDGDRETETSQAFLNVGGRLSSPDGRLVQSVQAHFFGADNDNLADGAPVSSTASDRLRLVYQADIRIAAGLLSLALEREETDFRQRGEVNFGDPNQDQSIDVTSIVMDLQGPSLGRLNWLLSARFDDNSEFEDAFTGRLSLAYALDESTSLRANVGTAQKNPTFVERFGFFPGQFIGNPNLDPERVLAYEIGIDRQLFDNRLALQLSLFQSTLDKEINGFVFDPVTFLSTAENRSGDSRRSGVELGVNWQATDSFSLQGSYTYTDSTFDDAAGLESRELRRPRHLASVSSAWRFANERAQLALTADYNGESIDQFFPPFPDPSRIVSLDNFWLVDLNLGYELSAASSVFVRAANLLDEDYEQVFGYRTLGRTVFAGLRMSFGR